MEEIDQEMSLEKKQSKLEKISRLATGIKIIQGQPLPGSARNASYCANTRGESMALHSIPKSEGLGGFFPSSYLFLQEGSGTCPWNPTSFCSPHSQVFSLKHAAPDSRGWDPEEADIKKEHLPSGDTPFLSPSCLKDRPFSRDWENETLSYSGQYFLVFTFLSVPCTTQGRCFIKIIIIYSMPGTGLSAWHLWFYLLHFRMGSGGD